MRSIDFNDRTAVLLELEKLGVMNDLKILAQIQPLHDRKNTLGTAGLTNVTKGHGNRDYMVSDMHRVTLTGDYESLLGSPIAENLSILAKGLLPEAYGSLLHLNPMPGRYRYHPYNGVKCWEVTGFCSLFIQSAHHQRGTEKIRWKGLYKSLVVSETTRYVQPTLPIQGLEAPTGELPPRLPALMLAYAITPEGDFKELILGLPTMVEHRNQSPWVWTIDLLAYATSSPLPVAATSGQDSRLENQLQVPSVPDAPVKLKKMAK